MATMTGFTVSMRAFMTSVTAFMANMSGFTGRMKDTMTSMNSGTTSAARVERVMRGGWHAIGAVVRIVLGTRGAAPLVLSPEKTKAAALSESLRLRGSGPSDVRRLATTEARPIIKRASSWRRHAPESKQFSVREGKPLPCSPQQR
jgi:hypothetical protein